MQVVSAGPDTRGRRDDVSHELIARRGEVQRRNRHYLPFCGGVQANRYGCLLRGVITHTRQQLDWASGSFLLHHHLPWLNGQCHTRDKLELVGLDSRGFREGRFDGPFRHKLVAVHIEAQRELYQRRRKRQDCIDGRFGRLRVHWYRNVKLVALAIRFGVVEGNGPSDGYLKAPGRLLCTSDDAVSRLAYAPF